MTNWLSRATGALKPLGNAANRPSLTRRALERRSRPPTFSERLVALRWSTFVKIAFVLLVAGPVAVVALYSMFMASPSYVTEVRLAVREATDRPLVDSYLGAKAFDAQPSPSADRNQSQTSAPTGSSGSSRAAAIVSSVLSALGGKKDAAEPYVVTDYVSSLELVNKLDQDGWLRARFAGGDPDWVQAFPASGSKEDLLHYWRGVASASLDTTTGLISFTIKAFSPQDSQAIAQRVVEECDALLSRMTERARHDRMRDARDLVGHAQDRLVAAQAALRALRSDEYQINPQMVADSAFQHLMSLISARISLDVQLRVMSPGLDEDAPQLKVLRARIAALDKEIDRAQAALTGPAGTPGAAANYLAEYETLETERLLAVSLYQSALDSLERMRLATERQAFYLATFVPPLAPEHASGPDVKSSVGVVALVGLLLWVMVTIIAAASRDQAGAPR